MQITVYCNEEPLYLCDFLSPELKEVLKHPDAIFIDELSTAAVNTVIHEIKKEQFVTGVMLHHDFDKLVKMFFKHFIMIEAAGGIVTNEQNEILFIHRRGKWDLPKGKLEKGETIEVCAQREIEEETGIKNLQLKHKIGETYHTYDEFGKHILKKSHWYYFTSTGTQNLIAQAEEDITAVTWFKEAGLQTPLADTFGSIKEIVAKFLSEVR